MNHTLQWISARAIFYPTLWWNMVMGRLLKVRNWWDAIDNYVIVGAFPFDRDVKPLAELGVGGVVNTCEEYQGPVEKYKKYDIEQFRMPTIDFTHPIFEDVVKAVEFIEHHVERGKKVYVHCKAGRARSATVAMCWLMKTQQISKEKAQATLLQQRPHINPRLTQRPVVIEFEKQFVKRK